MLHLARLARHAAEACSPEAAGSPQKLADLKLRAFGQFGNALRVCGRLHESEEALAVASSLLPQGTSDPIVRALLLNQMAALRIFQRRFEEAITLLEQAEDIYRDLRDRREVASTLLQRSIAHLYAGELEVTVRVLQRAMAWIDEEEDPHLLLAARHNMVRCYIDMGRHQEALALYFEVRELNKRFQDPLIQLRIAWQEGQLLRGLGHLREAEEKLLEARRGFLQRGLAYEVAVVSLDLAEVYAKMGRVDEVNQLVGETVPIFRALRIGRELLATLIQLRQTVHQERQVSDLGPS
jgi:tetratricopeptide (TPR) repeat protein